MHTSPKPLWAYHWSMEVILIYYSTGLWRFLCSEFITDAHLPPCVAEPTLNKRITWLTAEIIPTGLFCSQIYQVNFFFFFFFFETPPNCQYKTGSAALKLKKEALQGTRLFTRNILMQGHSTTVGQYFSSICNKKKSPQNLESRTSLRERPLGNI